MVKLIDGLYIIRLLIIIWYNNLCGSLFISIWLRLCYIRYTLIIINKRNLKKYKIIFNLTMVVRKIFRAEAWILPGPNNIHPFIEDNISDIHAGGARQVDEIPVR
jgi:hypothetical protein